MALGTASSFTIVLSFLLVLLPAVQAWVSITSLARSRTSTDDFRRTVQADVVPSSSSSSSALNLAATDVGASSLLVAQEAWRQYVVLATCLFVLGDVLLGSPFMNAVMKPIQDASGLETENNGGSLFASLLSNDDSNTGAQQQSVSKERVDTEQIAQDAVEKARNLLENLDYLEKSKTDYDRMDDLKRKMDRQISSVDKTLAERRQQMEEEE